MAETDDEEEEGGGGWLVSYADLMTLLFAAFVVLYGITPQGESDEILGMMASIRESFVEIPDDIPESFRRADLFRDKKVFKRARQTQPMARPIKKFNRRESPIQAKNLKLDQVDSALDKKSKGEGIHTPLRKGTESARDEYGHRLKHLGIIKFKPGAWTLDPDAYRLISNYGSKALKNSEKLLVEGHSQELLTGTKHSDVELAILRAREVKRILIKRVRYPEKLISTASYGSLRPMYDGQKIAEGKLNDRVELKIIY